MDIEKYALPLTIVASVIAIAAYIRGTGTAPVAIGGAAPIAATIPSFAAVPNITYNVATPTPPAVTVGTSYVPFAQQQGVIVSNGFGTGSPPPSSGASQNGTGSGMSDCGGCDDTSINASTTDYAYYNTVMQSAHL